MQLYEQQRDALQSGRKPRNPNDALTLRDVCNRFLTQKQSLLATGEIAARTFADYQRTIDRLIRVFGKDRPIDDLKADDFAALRVDIAAKWGPIALGNEIQRIRTVFRFAYEAELIATPTRFGHGFKRPRRSRLAKQCAAPPHGKKNTEQSEAISTASMADVRKIVAGIRWLLPGWLPMGHLVV